MTEEHAVDELRRRADRVTELAQTAELMGDVAGAERLHATASALRLEAMNLLDD